MGQRIYGSEISGQVSAAMRIVALIAILILGFVGTIVLTRAGIVLPEWFEMSRRLIWGVVAFSALGVVMNLATPSKWERIIWAPVALVLLGCSLWSL